jgi:hypothetical protein
MNLIIQNPRNRPEILNLTGIFNTFSMFFGGIGGLPVITLQSYSKNKISAITGMDISSVVFKASESCDQWEARADGNGSVGSGLLVGNGGNINANQDINFDIENEELTNGDKSYEIDIFGHNSLGWSSKSG